MADRSLFAQGSFAETGLPSGSADAVMTVDALQYARSKVSAMAEVARILRSGRRFGFVAFELDADRIAGLPLWADPVGDFRPLLDAVGFEVLHYEQILGWQDLVAAGFGAVVAEREALESELGLAATAALVGEASVTLDLQPYRGHVLGIAERR